MCYSKWHKLVGGGWATIGLKTTLPGLANFFFAKTHVFLLHLHVYGTASTLCHSVSYEWVWMSEYFIQTLWKVMHNYHQIKLWHEQYDSKSTAARMDREDAEVAFNRNYVRQKLEHGLLRVWRVRKIYIVHQWFLWCDLLQTWIFSFQDVQQKVRPYLLGIDMSHFKYDDFIRVLGIVKRSV